MSNPQNRHSQSLLNQMQQEFRWWMIPLVIIIILGLAIGVVLLDTGPQQPFLYDVSDE